MEAQDRLRVDGERPQIEVLDTARSRAWRNVTVLETFDGYQGEAAPSTSATLQRRNVTQLEEAPSITACLTFLQPRSQARPSTSRHLPQVAHSQAQRGVQEEPPSVALEDILAAPTLTLDMLRPSTRGPICYNAQLPHTYLARFDLPAVRDWFATLDSNDVTQDTRASRELALMFQCSALGEAHTPSFCFDGQKMPGRTPLHEAAQRGLELTCSGHKTSFVIRDLLPITVVDEQHGIPKRNEWQMQDRMYKDFDITPATLNAQDQAGVTPLMLAAGLGHLSFVKWAIAAGADINLADRRGLTALHYTVGLCQHRTLFWHVAQRERGLYGPECRQALSLSADAFRRHLDMEFTPGDRDGTYHNRATEIARVLLRAGVNPNAQDTVARRTPLMYLALNARCLEGIDDTPTADAKISSIRLKGHFSDQEAIARLLIQYGATTLAVDLYGNTALQLASAGWKHLVLRDDTPPLPEPTPSLVERIVRLLPTLDPAQEAILPDTIVVAPHMYLRCYLSWMTAFETHHGQEPLRSLPTLLVPLIVSITERFNLGTLPSEDLT